MRAYLLTGDAPRTLLCTYLVDHHRPLDSPGGRCVGQAPAHGWHDPGTEGSTARSRKRRALPSSGSTRNCIEFKSASSTQVGSTCIRIESRSGVRWSIGT